MTDNKGILFYDVGCHFCVRLADQMRTFLARHHIRLLPLQTPGCGAKLGRADAELMAQIWLLLPDGRSLGGADALLEISRHFWWTWPLRQMARLPVIMRLFRAVYYWIARHRHCASETCAIEEPTESASRAHPGAALEQPSARPNGAPVCDRLRAPVGRPWSGAHNRFPNTHVQSRLEAGAPATTPSAAARERMLASRGERMFVAGWADALMIHFEVEAAALQRAVPFQLDLWHGRAFVSLVAFTMRGMRPIVGGKLTALLFRPIATHGFLNVRTYVRHDGEPGIHFIAEWLNSWLATKLGPTAFGLPYRHGLIEYQHDRPRDGIRGQAADARTGGKLIYQAGVPQPAIFQPCPAGSLDEWLMERYIAFNSAGGSQRSFRVWHPPWPQSPADVEVLDDSLLMQNWPWFAEAKMIGANYSPGFHEVWMGRPRFCPTVTKRPQRFRHGAFFGEPI